MVKKLTKKLNLQLFKDMVKLSNDILDLYIPSRFMQLLETFNGDGCGLVFKLLEKKVHSGFEELKARRRLDLTVEALVIEKYKEYFPEYVIKTFQSRLKAGGYIPKKNVRKI